MTDAVGDVVQRILADILNLPYETVTADFSRADSDNWDSLQNLNIVLALEETYGVQFEPEEMEQMASVRVIVTLVEAKRLASARG